MAGQLNHFGNGQSHGLTWELIVSHAGADLNMVHRVLIRPPKEIKYSGLGMSVFGL